MDIQSIYLRTATRNLEFDAAKQACVFGAACEGLVTGSGDMPICRAMPQRRVQIADVEFRFPATSGRSPRARKFDLGERPKVRFAATSLDLSSACPGNEPSLTTGGFLAIHRLVPTTR
jgi:hypothetical protein